MVKYSKADPSLDEVFAALTDPTRRAMLAHLRAGPATVTELAAPLGATLPAMAKHLAVLERTGLITTRKVGRSRHCTLRAGALRPAAEWMDGYRRFWADRLDSLEDYLEENP
ncbi:transcriptional regulator, ArsR family [Beutenbergia cavernae DSM 12333]|uniref:Transcriptional regulator, ArsR family n=1 Tax=Beutenbergia cavernae (strain ATCC BAA-8 / DSM 12333 / CCUG 43141 / JCM 11478 / NBRC 16432 / NCIMB 13614 / HKI 0122) TaxID=471853 RepID=C5C0D2_BEUC1|nr:metalloregulator ArsR/SmtB family transcription factor [Beutenbergia cavernae]ACQ79318.1 transcriptional regulator, ArsR family [Beutenbergia cavernae DSM 12333]